MEIKYHLDMSKVPAKLNPQQTQIVQGLLVGSKSELTKDEILELITPVLVTKQDPWLIFKYYQPTFVETGMLSLDKINKPKAEKKTKNPAGYVVIELQGPPRPPEAVETVEELQAQGW